MNVCCVPVPADGVTDTAIAEATTHVPSTCQLTVSYGFAASIYMFFVPVNAGRNEICRFSVSVLPAADTLDPLPLNTHWLFCCVPLPGAMELAGCAPPSVSSASVFSARL